MKRSSSSGLISLAFTLLTFSGVFAQQKDARVAAQCLQVLTDVMIHDITSPLIASRDYAYSMIAFYEASRHDDNNFLSYAGQLNGLKKTPDPLPGETYDWLVAGTTAFYKTSYTFVFSKALFQQYWDSLETALKNKKYGAGVYERSVLYGEQVADHILQWAQEDQYVQTRTLPRFTPSPDAGTWQQTSPDYMEAIEPNWNQMRTMVLASPGEISIPSPATYKSEKFLKACKEVYETKNNLSGENKWIANFWDCNPFATQTVGHLMYSIKKISPGGHWLGISGVAIHKTGRSLVEALAAYSLVSVALFDGFIACWDVKFKTNYIRPVSAIQQLISPAWEPVLQTPPFPEYPSGHSVISMASAVVLTQLFGDHFSYTDDVEKPYGIENRNFSSFYAAANEAAISRLYGGIHFREAIENGSEMGRKIGEQILSRVILKRKDN